MSTDRAGGWVLLAFLVRARGGVGGGSWFLWTAFPSSLEEELVGGISPLVLRLADERLEARFCASWAQRPLGGLFIPALGRWGQAGLFPASDFTNGAPLQPQLGCPAEQLRGERWNRP